MNKKEATEYLESKGKLLTDKTKTEIKEEIAYLEKYLKNYSKCLKETKETNDAKVKSIMKHGKIYGDPSFSVE